jgi:hypothetical protein
MPDEEPKCCAVRYERAYGPRRCEKPGKVQEDGKWYCGVHNPELKRQRDAKWRAQHEAKSRCEEAAYRRRAAEAAACRGVATEHLREGLLAELMRLPEAP